jgi:excisionase family DNA binding protein
MNGAENMPHESKISCADARLLVTSREAAASLAVSVRTLQNLQQRGELTAVRIGRAVRFDPADLRRLIDQRKGVGK